MNLILEDFVFCNYSVSYCVLYRLCMNGGCLSCVLSFLWHGGMGVPHQMEVTTEFTL